MKIKVGILITNNSIFQNGLMQNAYFLYQVFHNAGHACSFLSYDPKYKLLAGPDIPVQTITDGPTFEASYKCIITVGVGISQSMYQTCKLAGTRVLGFVCGNILAMNTMDFITPGDKSSSFIIGKSSPVDKFWMIEGHSYMKGYLEILRNAPVICVPHVWSPKIFIDFALEKRKKTEADLMYPKFESWDKINVIILEPNIQFLKSALIPLTICEWLEKKKKCIAEVFVFNFPTESTGANLVVDKFEVGAKIRKFAGLPTVDILLHFNKKDIPYVVISHQINNPWNYIYYEMFYFGVPLIHNSDSFKGYGYYYEKSDVEAGALSVLNAMEYHEKLKTIQAAKNKTLLSSMDPNVKETIEYWDNLLMKEIE
jgi:hypothetical protein